MTCLIWPFASNFGNTMCRMSICYDVDRVRARHELDLIELSIDSYFFKDQTFFSKLKLAKLTSARFPWLMVVLL